MSTDNGGTDYQYRIWRQQNALLDLASHEAVTAGDSQRAAAVITAAAAEALEVERTSIWVFSEDREELHCVDLFERTPDSHHHGAVLKRASFPHYFACVDQGGIIEISDARRGDDEQTQELGEEYLQPAQITSKLDAAVKLHGETVAVLALDHCGDPRTFEADETAFAGEVAEHFAQALRISERRLAKARIAGMNRLKEDLVGPGTLQTKATRITEGAVEILAVDFSRIWITRAGDLCSSGCVHADAGSCSDHSRCLHLLASSGHNSHGDGPCHLRVPFGQYNLGQVAAGKIPGFVSPDVVSDSGTCDQQWASDLGLVSAAGHRLLGPDGKTLGVLAMFSKKPLARGQVALLKTIAATASQAVQSATVEEELRQHRVKLELLVEQRTQALRLSEGRFRALVETTSDWQWEVDETGTYTYASPKVRDFLGYEPEEVVGQRPSDLMPAEEAARVEAEFTGYAEARDRYERLQNIHLHRDGNEVVLETSGVPLIDASGEYWGYRGISSDITQRCRDDEARAANLRFMENMERINQVISQTSDLEQMMREVLDAVQEIFGSDRVWLVFPCDPDAPQSRVPMETTRPEYPGATQMGVDTPMTEEIAESMAAALAAHGPIAYDQRSGRPLPSELAKRFGVLSRMTIAVYPKVRRPWLFGMDQCSHARIWSDDDLRLFNEISHRMADSLSSMISLRDLRHSEERFRALTERASDVVTIVGKDGKYSYVSPSVRQYGHFPEEIVGQTPRDLIHRADLPRFERSTRQARRRPGVAVRIDDVRFPVKGGSWVVLEGLLTCMFEQPGVDGFVFNGRDITERKQAEEALAAKTDLLTGLLYSIPDIVIVKDAAGVYLGCNPAFCELVGRSVDEITGKTDHDLFPQPKAEACRANDRKMVEFGAARQDEEWFDYPDGRRILVETIKAPLSNPDGRVIGILGVSRDITERKRAEEEIKVLHQQIEHILGATKTGLDIIDPEFNIRYVDSEYQKIYGDPTGMKCYDYFMDRKDPCPNCGALRALESGDVIVTEEILVREDNRPIQVTTIPFQNEQGEWLVAEVNVDITERKLAEEELRQEMMKRRMAEEQLRVLVADLEKANMELEHFAYVVTHDLKAPLRGIDSVATWLAEDYGEVLNDEGREYLDDLHSRTQWMHDLIDGILQYSRAGRAKAQAERLDSQAVVRDVIASLSPPPEISVEIQGPMPSVVYDRVLLSQIFQNLIGNAINHLGQPRGQVRVTSSELAQAWEFCVRDNGQGIKERDHERIFKIFQSLRPREDVESTGIGLALVRRIVERNEGTVRVESVYGEGSSFFFTVAKDIQPESSTPNFSILIIDSNVDLAKVIVKMLERAGHDVLHVQNATEASGILMITKKKIDVALLDMDLPGEDVLDLYSTLRKLRPEMKIIVCSSSGPTDAIASVEAKGADGVLYRPFKMLEFINLISNFNRD